MHRHILANIRFVCMILSFPCLLQVWQAACDTAWDSHQDVLRLLPQGDFPVPGGTVPDKSPGWWQLPCPRLWVPLRRLRSLSAVSIVNLGKGEMRSESLYGEYGCLHIIWSCSSVVMKEAIPWMPPAHEQNSIFKTKWHSITTYNP